MKARRESKPTKISDRAQNFEIHTGEKSFYTWCIEIRIGDRLKHSESWEELHSAAASYNCEVKVKSGGFVICPIGEKGAIQFSKIGLKNIVQKLGPFQASSIQDSKGSEFKFTAQPQIAEAEGSFTVWQAKKLVHKNALAELRMAYVQELADIKQNQLGIDKKNQIAILKMNKAVAMAELKNQYPGRNFRDYLVIEANKGNDNALDHSRRYGISQATNVLRKHEAVQLKSIASISGKLNLKSSRLPFTHHVERNGTIIFNFGNGQIITDSAIFRQVQLNQAAAISSQAVETALIYSTSRFGSILTLSGSSEFKQLAVRTAVLKNLNIQFTDPALQAYQNEFAKTIRQNNVGIRHSKAVPIATQPANQEGNNHDKYQGSNIDSNSDQNLSANNFTGANENAGRITTNNRTGLHELSNGELVSERDHSELLLQGDVQGDVGNRKKGRTDLRVPGTTQSGAVGKGIAGKKSAGSGIKPPNFHPGRQVNGKATKGL